MDPLRVKMKRDRAIVAGRRLERREGRPAERQAAAANHPAEGEFGQPEYVDQFGRQFRVAYLDRLGGWLPGSPVPPRPTHAPAHVDPAAPVKLWVRLRRGDTARWWMPGSMEPANSRLALKPVAPGLRPCTAQVVMAYRERPSRRTGFVLVRSEQPL